MSNNLKPAWWLLNGKLYTVEQYDDAGMGDPYPGQVPLYTKEQVESLLDGDRISGNKITDKHLLEAFEEAKNKPKKQMTPKVEKCFECDEPATWVRHTQFAGDHYYCDEHAHEEEDFGKKFGKDTDDYWGKVEDDEQ